MNAPVAIRFENLSKTFGRGLKSIQAVSHLNLEIQSGQVYGFLGPNGAGKTTTIRILMDLVRPTRGTATIYGQNVHQHPGVLKRVGALIESAAFYGYLSGRENLEVLAHTARDYRPERIAALLEHVRLADRADQAVSGYSMGMKQRLGIAALLEQVRLADRADRAVSGYSTGMKQRLGIAAAILGDPDLVILDEPTNGLDPAGIREMRGFIRSLVDENGKTVFLSSHLLNEVEQICDRVAIIHQGELVREGAVASLLTEGLAEVRVQASPVDQAAEVLREGWAVSHTDGWLTVKAAPEDSPHIVRRLVAQEISVHQVILQRPSLEEYFMTITQAAEPASSGQENPRD